MKKMKLTALFLLALLPFCGSTEHGTIRNRIDSLAEETATLDKIVKGLSKFKVSAYIQSNTNMDGKMPPTKVGDKNEHEDKVSTASVSVADD